MTTRKKLLKKIEKSRQQIRRFGVKRLGLFGSYARDEQKKESDVDLLVEFEKGMKTFDNYMDLKFFLEELFGCEVDLVIREALKPQLKPYVMGDIEYAEGL